MADILPDLLDRCDEAVLAADKLLAAARHSVRNRLGGNGPAAAGALDRHQRAAHALAWYATYAEALRQMARWGRALNTQGRFGDIETLILKAAFGEYLTQLVGGIPMSQNEIARPYDMGLGDEDSHAFWRGAVPELAAAGTAAEIRAR